MDIQGVGTLSLAFFAAGLLFILVLKLIFGKSILFPITAWIVIPMVMAAICGTIVFQIGIKHILWLVPLFATPIVAVFFVIARLLRKPLDKITRNMEALSQGNVNIEFDETDLQGDNEFNKEFRSMDMLVQGMKNIVKYATNIGLGDLNSTYTLSSENDMLGKALIEMQDNLKAAKIEENRLKQQEEERNWIAQGLANFGDILRKNDNSLKDLSSGLLNSLIEYLDANQGGIFAINNTNPDQVYLELMASFAFDHNQLAHQNIELGEGLVGTCAVEKETIYITNVPEDYAKISSGLGEDKPYALLIVPLKINDKIFGVIEIGTFSAFKPFQISFVEQLAESVASTISSAKGAEQTQKLLEQTQLQAEELKKQEETLRQNLEELQATQEEFARIFSESQVFLNAVYAGSYVAEFDTNRTVIAINDLFVETIKVPREKIVGQPFNNFVGQERDLNGQPYEKMWVDILSGHPQTSLDRVVFPNGTFLVLREHWAPIPDSYGKIYKVMVFSTIDQNAAKNLEK